MEAVHLERRGHLLIATIDHPRSALNAVDQLLHDDLAELFATLKREGDARAIVLTGGSKRAFSAGGDFEWFPQLRHVELLDPLLYGMDSALFGDSETATTSWAGLDHLEGETVAVRADGAPIAPLVVTGGTITTPAAVSAIEVGLAFVPTLEPMDAVDGADDGPAGAALGRDKSNWQVSVLVAATVGLQIDGREVVFRQVDDEVNAPIPGFTGSKLLSSEGWSTHGRFTITQPVPAPVTVLAYVARTEVSGG